MQKKYIIFFWSLCGAISLQAQIKINGIITEADGTGLVGVTILEKGTDNGTVTDFDGKYEMTVDNSDAILVYSYTGYSSQEITVSEQTAYDLVMQEDIANLDEIIVVGYGTQKKKVVSAAIAKIDSKDLEDMPVVNIANSLQGRASGVRVSGGSGQPGDGGTVRIRGTTTLGNSDPLYIVDGVIIGGGIDYLNQGDIESIEVLKDAASAGIYGARGANGVILVTTKSGNSERTEVGYNFSYGTQAPARQLALLNATEYATLMNEASVAAGGNLLFADPASFGEGTDWQSAIFRNDAPRQQHDLNFSMGNEKSSYFVSFSYFNQEGIVSQDQSNYKRFTVRLNSNHKLTKNITFGNNIAYTKTKSRGISTNSEFGGALSRALNIDPITPILETDPDVLANNVFQTQPVVTNADSIPYGISTLVTSEIVNPVAALSVGEGYGWSDKIVGNFYGEVKLFKDFKFRSSIGGDLAFWGGESFTPIFYLNGSNLSEQTVYNRGKNNGFYYIFENTLTYSKKIQDHKFDIVIGTAAEKNQGEGISGTITDVPFDNLDDASFGFPVPADNQTTGGFEYYSTGASYIGRINYNFREKYLLSFVYRRDGSSNFGDNNKFGNFPAVSAGWIASDEDCFPVNDAVNFLKIRASWGKNGNDRIGGNSFISTIGGGRNYTFGLGEELFNGSSPNILSNPNIRWESTTQTNIGFDAKLFRKFSLTFDAWQKVSEGILGGIATPAYVGIGGLNGNVSDMKGQGIDLELGYGGSIGEFDFSLSGNVSYARNEVTDLGPDKEFLTGDRYGPPGIEISRTVVGEAINSFFGYTTAGLFQTEADVLAHANADGDLLQPDAAPGDIRFVDINNDGILDDGDRSIIGDPTPTWTYGLNFRADWNNFDVTVFAHGEADKEIYKATRRFDLEMANLTADALGRWTGEGTSDDYPRLVMGDPNKNFSRSSDFNLEDGSYFRIGSLQLGYTFQPYRGEKISFRSIRVYVSGNNLFTFTNYSGLDPSIIGIDRGFYPQPRFFLAGVNVKF